MKLVFEIIRQGKKGFTLYSQSGILDVEMLIAAAAMGRALSTEVAFANLAKELEARGKMSG